MEVGGHDNSRKEIQQAQKGRHEKHLRMHYRNNYKNQRN
jgi:hypothetical protein